VRLRFDGSILGVGTEQGTRLVAGMWSQSPFGPIADVMVERADGRRLLIAPNPDVAEFIAATYRFDEIRIEAADVIVSAGRRSLATESLHLTADVGRRSAVGWLLRAVPGVVARSPAWSRAIGPVARLVRPGVRTTGTAGGGRREFYCPTDERLVTGVRAVLDGIDLGALRPVSPPVSFGFGSAPVRPSLVSLTTVIELAPGQ
jgi:hypothetical protein